MKKALSFGLLVLFLCYCPNVSAKKKTCTFTNKQGRVKTFFKTFEKVALFPCSYLLADFTCGEIKTQVTAENALDPKGNLFIRAVAVETTTKSGTKTYTQTNTVTTETIKKYLKARQFEKRLWLWTVNGVLPEMEQRILGYYDRKLRSAYIERGDLRVDFWTNTDTVSISCDDQAITEAVPFPRTMCGSPENTYSDLETLDKALPTNGTVDLSSTRLTFMQLARMKLEQTKPVCAGVSNLVSSKCSFRGDKLYLCQNLYSPFETATKGYGKCLRQKKIDALEAYMVCVRVLCGGFGVDVSFKECRLLKTIMEKCGELEKAAVDIKEIFHIAQCSVPLKYRISTTTRPPPSTKAPATTRSITTRRTTRGTWSGGW